MMPISIVVDICVKTYQVYKEVSLNLVQRSEACSNGLEEHQEQSHPLDRVQ